MMPQRRQTDWVNLAAVIIICAAVLFFIYIDLGCTPNQHYPMPVVETPCDAAYYHILNSRCANLLIIPGADEIPGTADDMDWIQWCLRIQTSGFYRMDLDCIMNKTTCHNIESCL